MEQSEQIRVAELTLARQLQWIQAVETKLSILVAISVGMLGLLAARIPDEFESWKAVVGLTALGAIGVVVTIIFCGLATFPRLKHNNSSLLFFGTIASRNQDEFLTEFKKASESDYLDDLLYQLYQNAIIAKAKYGHVKHAIIALLFSTPLWLISVYSLGAF